MLLKLLGDISTTNDTLISVALIIFIIAAIVFMLRGFIR